MNDIEISTGKLIESLRKGEAYQRYVACEKALRVYPELEEQLDKLRRDTIEMYSTMSGDELLAHCDELTRRHQEMQKIPQVNAYIEAEAELCSEVRRVYRSVIDAIGIRMPGM